MSESAAEVKYREFESLKSRFGCENKPDPDRGSKIQSQQLQNFQSRRESGSKRRAGSQDIRANAPPLVPLVEEGDELEEVIDNRALVKRRWKPSSVLKCNHVHLNFPDFDALETASSTTSNSSAYSSKSESGIRSPPSGSATELSESGSCDTFQEYDVSEHRSHKVAVPPHHGTAGINGDPIRHTPSDMEVPPHFVRGHARAWNKAVGEWTFEGVSPPLTPHTLRVTNEVRVPTPPWTPQSSTDNLLEFESRSSLISSGDDGGGGWIPERYVQMGKFVSRRSCSTSNLVSAFQSMMSTSSSNASDSNHMRSFSGTDLLSVSPSSQHRTSPGADSVVSSVYKRPKRPFSASSRVRLVTVPKWAESPPPPPPRKSCDHEATQAQTGLSPQEDERAPSLQRQALAAGLTGLSGGTPQEYPSIKVSIGRQAEDEASAVTSLVKQRTLLFGGTKK